MTKRLLMMVMASLLMLLGANARVAAHPGHEHKVLGTITMAAADHVMLKDKAGKELTIKVTKDTRIKSKSPVKVEEIKAGTRVVVSALLNKDKTMTATSIEVGPAPAAP
jgi:hypothetical protein